MKKEDAIKELELIAKVTVRNARKEAMEMAIEALQTIDNCDQCEWCCPSDGISTIHAVRCKDCKYMTEHYDTDDNASYWTCSQWDCGTDYDGFCHYAERREP